MLTILKEILCKNLIKKISALEQELNVCKEALEKTKSILKQVNLTNVYKVPSLKDKQFSKCVIFIEGIPKFENTVCKDCIFLYGIEVKKNK